MNNSFVIKQTLLFFTYILVQALFASNLELFGLAFCFLYVNYLLIFPLESSRVLLLILGFLLGFVLDIFYDTLGMHSAACVLVAYVRPFVIRLMTSKNDFSEISIKETGFGWFFNYAFTLILIHHLFLFFLLRFSFLLFFDTLVKAIASTLFTLFSVIIIQYLFYSPNLSNARR